MAKQIRRRSLGAEAMEGGVDFRLDAPCRSHVKLVIEGERRRIIPMDGAPEQGFHCFVPELQHGTRYHFLLDDNDKPLPDPASRSQPDGPHGPSEVIDPARYTWRDTAHRGRGLHGAVLYELHIGTFTAEGTYRAAARQLPALAELGITTIELMPICEFPGAFGWGYDGVNLFAPSHLYGTPDDLRFFVDEAHLHGMCVILDVVYNHLGPDGNYLAQFSQTFFSAAKTEWGDALNFDGPHCAGTRRYFIENATYWIEEFHFDGLRLDATQQIFDTSQPHIVQEIVQHVRAAAAPRQVVIIAENEPQQSDLVQPVARGGMGCDALWNDDFHHSAMVAATGHSEAYYSDTRGTPQELISAMKWGYLYQGQYYAWQKQTRGTPALDLPAPHFVLFLQNHDQVANSARGLRLHATTTPGRARALKALMLLAPGTPMLFQGEEFDASAPFYYFADHHPELAAQVRAGRQEFMRQFPSLSGEDAAVLLPDPADQETFLRCKLDHAERERHGEAVALTRELLALRKRDPVFRAQRADRMHGAVLDGEAFVLRHVGEDGDDRLVLVNLGRDLTLHHAPEPLLAPPRGAHWELLFSTEDPRYGGGGTPPLSTSRPLQLRGHALFVLAARRSNPAETTGSPSS